jgi:hypothetical protein
LRFPAMSSRSEVASAIRAEVLHSCTSLGLLEK